MKPLVVQCQETTDYSKLELKLACRVNKQCFQAQCAVDGSPWSTCALFKHAKVSSTFSNAHVSLFNK